MSARFLPKGYTRVAEPPSPTSKNLGRLVAGLFGESKRSLRTDHLTTKDDKNIYDTHASFFKDVANYSDPVSGDNQIRLKFHSSVSIHIRDGFNQRAVLVDKPSKVVIKNLFVFVTESSNNENELSPEILDNLDSHRTEQSSKTADCKFELLNMHLVPV